MTEVAIECVNNWQNVIDALAIIIGIIGILVVAAAPLLLLRWL